MNASSATLVAGGPLPGLAQTVPRAELTAALAATSWAFQQSVQVVVWADALYVVPGARALQDGCFCWETCENRDLWQQLASVLHAMPDEDVLFQHVHSHIQVDLCESPAGLYNLNSFVQTHAAAVRYKEDMLSTVRALRQMYDAIGEQDQQRPERPRREFEDQLEPASEQEVGEERFTFLSDLLPVAWMLGLEDGRTSLPRDFLQEFMQFLLTQDECTEGAFRVSLLELAVMMHCSGVVFPVVGTGLARWVSSAVSHARGGQTLAVQLRAVRQAANWAASRFGLESVVCHRLDVTGLGCTIPFDGFLMGCELGLLHRSRDILRGFSARRLIKTAAGFARPLAA